MKLIRLTIACTLLMCAVHGYTQTTKAKTVQVTERLILTGDTLTDVTKSLTLSSTHYQTPTAKSVYMWVTTNFLQGVTKTARFTGTGTALSPLELAQQGATSGQVLKWNGTSWAPASDATGGADSLMRAVGLYTASSGTLPTFTPNENYGPFWAKNTTDAAFYKWNRPTSAWVPDTEALTGDVTKTSGSTVTTIANSAVTNAKIANNAVNSAKIVDGSIVGADIATNTIPPSAISDAGVTSGQVMGFNGLAWGPVSAGGPPSGSAGGDLTGTYPNPGVRNIQGRYVNPATPGVGDIYKWDGSQWTPMPDTTGGSAVFTTLKYDNNRLPATYNWVPSKGLNANEYVTNYPPGSIDKTKIKFSTSPFGTGGYDYGGWLANGTSGDSIAVSAGSIVLIGDSQAAGGGGRLAGGVFTPGTQEVYGQIAYTLRLLTHKKVFNHGISGQKTPEIWARWQRDVLAKTYNPSDGRGAKTLNRRPDCVIIVAGINDVFSTNLIADSTIFYLEKMAKSAKAEGMQCVMLNLPGHLGASAANYARIDSINTYMASGALQALGVSVVDYNGWWKNAAYGDEAHANSLIADVVHPTSVGYDSLARIIFRTAKLPVLDSLRLYTEISPDGFAGYSRPTNITVNGVSYSIANASKVTIPWTTPMDWDSVWIKIVGSTSVTGTTYSGFSHIEWLSRNDTTSVVTKRNPLFNNYQGRGIYLAGPGISLTDRVSGTTITNTGDSNASDDITGSGTVGQIPTFSAAQVLGNSSLYAVGGNFGIGVASPLTHEHIYATGTSSTYGSIFIQTPQPAIVQQCERASGGAIYAAMKGTLKNTTTGLSTKLYEIGVFGDARSGATAPTLNNFYIATKPTGGTSDAALTIDALQNTTLWNTTTMQGAGTTNAETIAQFNNSASSPAMIITGDLNTSIRGKMKVGGAGTPTAYLHLYLGTATAGTAPLKFSVASSNLLTAPESGAIEVGASNSRIYYTGSSLVRNTIAYSTDYSLQTTTDNGYITTRSIRTDSSLIIRGTNATNNSLNFVNPTSSTGATWSFLNRDLGDLQIKRNGSYRGRLSGTGFFWQGAGSFGPANSTLSEALISATDSTSSNTVIAVENKLSGDATFIAKTGGAGDPKLSFINASTSAGYIGADQSDSLAIKAGIGSAVGTNSKIRITQSGISIGANPTAPSAGAELDVQGDLAATHLMARGSAPTVSMFNFGGTGTSPTTTVSYGGDMAFHLFMNPGDTPNANDYITVTFAQALPAGKKPIITWDQEDDVDLRPLLYIGAGSKSNTGFTIQFKSALVSNKDYEIDFHVISN